MLRIHSWDVLVECEEGILAGREISFGVFCVPKLQQLHSRFCTILGQRSLDKRCNDDIPEHCWGPSSKDARSVGCSVHKKCKVQTMLYSLTDFLVQGKRTAANEERQIGLVSIALNY